MAILLWWSPASFGQQWDGNELFRRLELDAVGDKTYDVGEATGFIAGVAAGYRKAVDCPPDVHVLMTRRAVIAHLKRDPESLQQSAATNVVNALKDVGICEK